MPNIKKEPGIASNGTDKEGILSLNRQFGYLTLEGFQFSFPLPALSKSKCCFFRKAPTNIELTDNNATNDNLDKDSSITDIDGSKISITTKRENSITTYGIISPDSGNSSKRRAPSPIREEGTKTPPEKKQKTEKKKGKKSKTNKGPIDLDRQCGVIISPGAPPCTRSLTCKRHPMAAKRGVPGRSQTYDILLQQYQKKSIHNSQLGMKNEIGKKDEVKIEGTD
ncbi:8742_t:CDS:2 [Ambispora gerdemannii]|uniref:8742_t:CDS:1 n=1 Tax=Ambispora gerdemannii TaxID=144530 RepID=A0A9N9FMS1_9GLOM|nr:8742_t:CDS:2 [Ambispora gerdemannii]